MSTTRESTRRKRRYALGATVLIGVLFVATGVIVNGVLERTQHGKFGVPLDVDPRSSAALAARSTQLTTTDRALLTTIAVEPTAVWVAGPAAKAETTVADAVAGSAKRHAVATLVAYNIPGRDCGSYSASADRVDADAYRAFVDAFVAGLGTQRAIVIVEPDALAQLDCLDAEGRALRTQLLAEATAAISAQGSWAYLDAGHSGWTQPAEMAGRLTAAGVVDAAGFSLNVSNFRSTAEEIDYGSEIVKLLGGDTHFVIDTSRNGVDVDDRQWCNPHGRGLGARPTTDTASDLVDAYLWIKMPGNSDGQCNGGPAAGEWWTSYALELARNAPPSGTDSS